MDIAQGKMALGFSCDMSGDDSVTAPLNVMSDIFGGGPYSRLFTNVREKMSLCYYCSAAPVRIKGNISVNCGIESENAVKAETEILNQLDIMRRGEFSDFEFESSIKSICDSLSSYNDSQTMLDYWYTIRVINKVQFAPEEYAELISKVTREDVINVANGVHLHTVYSLLPKEEEE
jgi:predicted Zn-dependent peptidase